MVDVFFWSKRTSDIHKSSTPAYYVPIKFDINYNLTGNSNHFTQRVCDEWIRREKKIPRSNNNNAGNKIKQTSTAARNPDNSVEENLCVLENP